MTCNVFGGSLSLTQSISQSSCLLLYQINSYYYCCYFIQLWM